MGQSKTIGLYFGTFNPIHIGHLNIAHYFAHHSNLDEVWLVVTPENPLKNKQSLLADYHRAALVDIALEDYPRLKTSRVEFDLPQPNYTVNTLAVLQEQNPEHRFALIMGEDNLQNLHKWKIMSGCLSIFLFWCIREYQVVKKAARRLIIKAILPRSKLLFLSFRPLIFASVSSAGKTSAPCCLKKSGAILMK